MQTRIVKFGVKAHSEISGSLSYDESDTILIDWDELVPHIKSHFWDLKEVTQEIQVQYIVEQFLSPKLRRDE